MCVHLLNPASEHRAFWDWDFSYRPATRRGAGDADGEVVGINVACIPPSGGAVSLGFAIPSVTVRSVVEGSGIPGYGRLNRATYRRCHGVSTARWC